MKSLIKKSILAIALATATLSVSAQEPLIKGYFRINTQAGENAGNKNYVEVTGPFTAKPNLTLTEATRSAGSIIYVEAVQDGDAYRLTSLRCQGIDVAKDVINPDDYDKILGDVINGNVESPVFALMRSGFEYGYTSIARAAVGSVFWFVASKLQNHVTDEDRNGTGDSEYKYIKDDYIEVARDFNRNVTSKLDLGIRLKPVNYGNNSVQVYFDVPSLEPVCAWYLDSDAKLFENTNPVSRHDVFASAMRAMSKYLGEKGINLETFVAEDVELLSQWGYNIKTEYPEYVNGNTVELTFDKIFSDPVLLFNWIKMVGYYVLNPEKDNHGLAELGYSDLANKAQEHYLTKLIVDYLPRLHHNTRAFLINGRVYNNEGNVSSGGVTWDAAGNTFGFANEREVALAGDNGVFVLHPVDNKTQIFQPWLYHNADNEQYAGKYAGFYFDFPISAVDDQVKFHSLGDLMEKSYKGASVEYVDLIEFKEDEIAALTPFILENQKSSSVLLNVADGVCKFEELLPENSLVLSNDEVAQQHAPRRAVTIVGDEDDDSGTSGDDDSTKGTVDDYNNENNLKGVLLSTPLDATSLANYWGIEMSSDNPVYAVRSGVVGNSTHLVFDTKKETLDANEIVYTAERPINGDDINVLVVGEPSDEDVVTGVNGVVNDTENDDESFYDLKGIKVEKPQSGNIYIHKGKKIFIL